MSAVVVLVTYAFLSNVALAVVPHEPVVIWYGPRLGVWATALLATTGTVAAAWVDHRLLAPMVGRLAARRRVARASPPLLERWFVKAPFAILATSGITPLPFFPFKVLAFAVRYPRLPYLAAVAVGRLPRYALLAWLGALVRLPGWAFLLVFALLLLPSLRMIPWPTRSAS